MTFPFDAHYRYLLGQDSGYPSVNFNANVQGTHGTLIRQIGAASTVLLKNTNNALPLKNPSSIAILGTYTYNSHRISQPEC